VLLCDAAKTPVSGAVSEPRSKALIGVLAAPPVYLLGVREACQTAHLAVVEVQCPPEGFSPGIDALVCCLCYQRDWAELDAAAAHRPRIPILALMQDPDLRSVERALCAGATGALPLVCDGCNLVDGISALLAGIAVLPTRAMETILRRPRTTELTAEEIDWLNSLAAGATIGELANVAGYSERQLYRKLRDAYGRLGVQSRTEALLLAQRRGLLTQPAGASALHSLS